jgi:hypothetical protein
VSPTAETQLADRYEAGSILDGSNVSYCLTTFRSVCRKGRRYVVGEQEIAPEMVSHLFSESTFVGKMGGSDDAAFRQAHAGGEQQRGMTR